MQEPIVRSLVAFMSGALGVPLLLIVIFRAILGDEVNGNGSAGFWSTIVIGAAISAIVVWFKQVPLWLALFAGPVAVLSLLVPWVAWRVIHAA